MCERPLLAFKNPDGGRPRFIKNYHKEVTERHAEERVLKLPCGKCLSCRLKHASEWSVRCQLESRRFEHNQFLTLTFDNEHLPANGVSKKELARFMHDLRQHYERKHNHDGIRFFACGEYGSKYLRPHYHILLFNCPPFGDEYLYHKNALGQPVYLSQILRKLWGKGHVSIGAVTQQSAGYVARYALKKIHSTLPKHMNPEFINMSRSGGIGFVYLYENVQQIYRYDEIILPEGKTVRPPKAFDKKFKLYIGDKAYEGTVALPRQVKAKALLAQALAQTGLTETEYLKQKAERQRERVKRLQRVFENNSQ